jgi:hypothetical protein
MKSKKLIVLVLALVLLLVTATVVSADSERKDFTILSLDCDWSTFDPGREIYSGNNFHARDLKVNCYTESTAPEYTGWMHLVVNNNWIGNQESYIQIGRPDQYFESDEGGIWRLKCVNMNDVVKCVGQGDGSYAGMQVFLDFVVGEGISGGGYIVNHH